jgi:hypothetical protein
MSWRVLKKRLLAEGNETVTNCNALKMTAPDGKQCLDEGLEKIRKTNFHQRKFQSTYKSCYAQ